MPGIEKIKWNRWTERVLGKVGSCFLCRHNAPSGHRFKRAKPCLCKPKISKWSRGLLLDYIRLFAWPQYFKHERAGTLHVPRKENMSFPKIFWSHSDYYLRSVQRPDSSRRQAVPCRGYIERRSNKRATQQYPVVRYFLNLELNVTFSTPISRFWDLSTTEFGHWVTWIWRYMGRCTVTWPTPHDSLTECCMLHSKHSFPDKEIAAQTQEVDPVETGARRSFNDRYHRTQREGS